MMLLAGRPGRGDAAPVPEKERLNDRANAVDLRTAAHVASRGFVFRFVNKIFCNRGLCHVLSPPLVVPRAQLFVLLSKTSINSKSKDNISRLYPGS